MPHGLVHESEEKLRAHFLHTGTPSATGLFISKAPRRVFGVSSFFLRVQLSQPYVYVATGHTSAFISRIFVGRRATIVLTKFGDRERSFSRTKISRLGLE